MMTYGTTTYQERSVLFLFFLPSPLGLSAGPPSSRPPSWLQGPPSWLNGPHSWFHGPLSWLQGPPSLLGDPPGCRALPAGCRALQADSEALSAGSRALPAGSGALLAGPKPLPSLLCIIGHRPQQGRCPITTKLTVIQL